MFASHMGAEDWNLRPGAVVTASDVSTGKADDLSVEMIANFGDVLSEDAHPEVGHIYYIR
jgi:hypothetical protein